VTAIEGTKLPAPPPGVGEKNLNKVITMLKARFKGTCPVCQQDVQCWHICPEFRIKPHLALNEKDVCQGSNALINKAQDMERVWFDENRGLPVPIFVE